MKFKHLMIAAASVLTIGGAQAQYMGIGQLASTESFNPTLLKNAIENKNEAFIEQWLKEKGSHLPDQPKDGKICYFSPDSYPNEAKFNPEQKNIFDNTAGNIVSYGFVGIFSPCAAVPLSILSQGLNLLASQESIAVFGRGGPYSITEDAIAKSKYQLKYLNEFLNGLKPNQWEQLIPLIVNQNLDFSIRSKALTMLDNFYPRRMSTGNEYQKSLYSAMETYAQTKPDYIARDMNHNIYLNPSNYLFQTLSNQLLGSLGGLSRSAYYHSGQIDKFTLNYWLDKNKVDVKKFKFDANNGHILEFYLKTYNNAELLKRIMKSPTFKINEQNNQGETYLHKLFDQRNYKDLQENEGFATYIRALLNKGADPFLLNTKKESPFMKFESVRGNSGKEVFDAFVEKEYNK